MRVALLISLGLLGFAAAYPLTSGSLAAVAGSTTVPSPDLPPPTTPPKPERPPPPPPPPAAPVRSYVAPPPPPVTWHPSAKTAPKPKPVHRRRHVRRTRIRTKPAKTHAIATTASTPQAPQPGVSLAALPVTSGIAPPEAGNSASLELFFGVALGCLLLGAALAAAPRAVLPGRASDLVERNRESVITLLCALAVGLALGLFLVVLS